MNIGKLTHLYPALQGSNLCSMLVDCIFCLEAELTDLTVTCTTEMASDVGPGHYITYRPKMFVLDFGEHLTLNLKLGVMSREFVSRVEV